MRHVTVETDKGASTVERRRHWHHNLSELGPHISSGVRANRLSDFQLFIELDVARLTACDCILNEASPSIFLSLSLIRCA